MKSISGKNWEELISNQRLIEKAKIDHNLNDIQAKLVVSRNFSDDEIYSINNRVNFKNPFLRTEDFLSGCSLLKKHIVKKNNLLVIGDYDVDGCISTSLMVEFLKENNAKVNFYIPDRIKDGYGANRKLIINLIKHYRPKLIIFLDCGSNSYDALKYIKSKNISSLVIDHHNTNKPYPLAEVFINPKKDNDYKKFSYFCSAFLTYFFIDLFIKKNNSKISIIHNLIYVLLATVADVMPIRYINKFLAISVLDSFDINKNFIFDNLFKILNIKKKLELNDLGFLIGPIINSAGRLENANQIVNLLISTSIKEKKTILQKILLLNHKRKLIEKRCLDGLDFKKISIQKGVLFIYEPNIPEGMIGIVASKLKDHFNKPCIVFTNSDDIVKGSARSTSDFNIGQYIQKAVIKKILISGGGHNLAAGLTLNKNKIDDFKIYLNNLFNKNQIETKNFYVMKISLHSINKKFINEIKLLGPFGNKNSTPIFLIEKIKIIKPQIIKNKFISCFIKKDKKMIKAISFNHLNTKISYEIENSKNYLDVYVKIKENLRNNKSSIELEIIDLAININKT